MDYYPEYYRILAIYLAMHAWKNNVDCIKIRRNALLEFMGRKKLRQRKLDELIKVLETVFTNIEPVTSDKILKEDFIKVSRFDFNEIEKSMREKECFLPSLPTMIAEISLYFWGLKNQ